MPPLWKIEREIKRLGRQLNYVHEIATGKMRRRYYDTLKRGNIAVIEGQVPLHKDVAIFLIYQPTEILESVIISLDFLKSKNISTILVSNTPIPEHQREKVLANCHLVIERPNFGYDFGGYRDGIIELMNRDICPQNLFVMNDSIWFPVRENETLIESAIEAKEDLFGIFYDCKSKQKRNHFLHSYFYRFNEHLLNSRDFRRFWLKAPMFNTKEVVILRQERRLTGCFKQMGYSIGALFDGNLLLKIARGLDNDMLWEVLEMRSGREGKQPNWFVQLSKTKASGGDWRSKAESIMVDTKFRYYFLDLPPSVYIGKLNAPIVKKHKGHNFRLQRNMLQSTGLDSEFIPTVRDEIRTWNDRI